MASPYPVATVRPHLAAQQPLPPSPPPSLPPAAPLPWSPPYTRCRTAGAHGRKESVAESCCPTDVAPDRAIDGNLDGGSDNDDCGSCVDGSEGTAGQENEEPGSDNVVWWCQRSSSGGGCFPWAPNAGRTTPNYAEESEDDGDPKEAAARRQEEDRKFWEECLSSGYPSRYGNHGKSA